MLVGDVAPVLSANNTADRRKMYVELARYLTAWDDVLKSPYFQDIVFRKFGAMMLFATVSCAMNDSVSMIFQASCPT